VDGLTPVASLSEASAKKLRGVFTDIDDTLTHDGKLVPEAFLALGQLQAAGLRVIAVTGRPGGWVDQIARLWPVDGVVGENGGLWAFQKNGKLHRHYLQSPEERQRNREQLEALSVEILRDIPGAALASDQAYRDLDLAIDFCEDVPALPDSQVNAIAEAFRAAGATAKISSIHVNGWFGRFDKLTGCKRLLDEAWGEDLMAHPEGWAYLGDSANDEPMFEAFQHSVGVANVMHFLPLMKAWPTYITEQEGGMGFAEWAAHVLRLRQLDT